MRDESVRIYIERLRDGAEHLIEEIIDPGHLDLSDHELAFKKKIACKGKAYLADTHLIVNLDVQAEAELPCTVCNEAVQNPILLKSFYITKPLDEIPTDVYHFADELREALLLEVPQFAECNEGKCDERENIEKYLAKKPEEPDDDEEVHYPFKDL